MTRVLAAALVSIMTVASAGLANAATQGTAATNSTVGTSTTVTAPTNAKTKVLDASKPVAHKKKDKAASAASSTTAPAKTTGTVKPTMKPAG